MTKEDIYGGEQVEKEHSLRFIHVVVRNVLGIVNRITSLLRRKRYFIEDISVTFDESGLAHIVLVMDMRLHDIEQVTRQIHKIHDVVNVYDMTEQTDKLYEAIYVSVDDRNSLDELPLLPVRVLPEADGSTVGVYMLTIEESRDFLRKLRQQKMRYIKRLIALV